MSYSSVVQEMYAAFGKKDTPAILNQLSPSVEQEYGISNRIPWVQHGIVHAAAVSFFASLSAPEFHLFNVKVHLEKKEAVCALVDVGATVKATGKKITKGQVYIWHFNE
jgi:ketosteroid isomerase-like protein